MKRKEACSKKWIGILLMSAICVMASWTCRVFAEPEITLKAGKNIHTVISSGTSVSMEESQFRFLAETPGAGMDLTINDETSFWLWQLYDAETGKSVPVHRTDNRDNKTLHWWFNTETGHTYYLTVYGELQGSDSPAHLNTTIYYKPLQNELGEYGPEILHTYDKSSGILKLTGTGETYDFLHMGAVTENSVSWPGPLKKVIIGEGITKLGAGLFEGQTKLKSVTLPSTLTEIGIAVFAKTGLTSVKLPENLVTIGTAAFSETKLKEVVIPDSVQTLEGWRGLYFGAFSECPLKTVVIGSGVKSIGGRTFFATQPQTITFRGKMPAVESQAFLLSFRDTLPGKVKVRYPLSWSSVPEELKQAEQMYKDGNFILEKYLPAPTIKSVKNTSAGKATVTWAKVSKAKQYEIAYGLKKKFSNAKTVKVSSSKTKKVLSGLKKGKTYYVRVRGIAGNTPADWSETMKVKIRK